MLRRSFISRPLCDIILKTPVDEQLPVSERKVRWKIFTLEKTQ